MELVEKLTKTEQKVLELLVGGFKNHEIARDLCLSEGYVEQVNQHIYSKLGVNSRAQAAVAALRLNLVKF